MKYRKGELFCAVLNCTSRDYSSARSLLEFKPQVVTVFSNEKKNTESTWYGIHKPKYGLSEYLTSKARYYSFFMSIYIICLNDNIIITNFIN